MSANKKNTAKAIKSPAPAKTAKPAVKTSAAKTPGKKAMSPAAVIVSALARASATTAAENSAAVNTVPAKAATTTVVAQADVGFGNSLYIRGEGAGLSWEKGRLMACAGNDRWQIELGESARPIRFKFLVNDTIWSSGEDYAVTAGAITMIAPQF